MRDGVTRAGAVEVGRRNQVQDTFCRKSQQNLLRGEMRGERERKESRLTQDSQPESPKWGGCRRQVWDMLDLRCLLDIHVGRLRRKVETQVWNAWAKNG